MTIRINLFSGPRNISTALMYAFAQRQDTIVFDEPLYSFYLSNTGKDHPGKDEIIASQETNGDLVIKDIILGEHSKSVLFLKQMTHHLLDLDLSFLKHTKNILLIRDPLKVLTSYHKVIEQLTINDIGILQSYNLYLFLKKNNYDYLIVDADRFLAEPKQGLLQICNHCHISFDEKMLNWETGGIKEDGIWAKYWYENVHRSTEFAKQNNSEIILKKELESIYNEATEYYTFFLQKIN